MKKLFRKTSLNKDYYDLCRNTQRCPMVAGIEARYFFYTMCIEDLYRHLSWYVGFAKKNGLVLKVKG